MESDNDSSENESADDESNADKSRTDSLSIVDPSYYVLSDYVGGRKLVIFTQINVILSLLGSAISRMIAAGGIIVILYEQQFKQHIDDNTRIKQLDMYAIIGFSIIILFPLSLMRDMSSLRFTSLLSVSCSLFLTCCLFAQYFILCNRGDDTTCIWNIVGNRTGLSVFMHNEYSRLGSFEASGVLTAVPLFVFGYNCQANVFPIYKDLEGTAAMSKSDRMKQVFKHALIISCSLYLVAGSCAFLIFLEETQGNILLNDFRKSTDILVASVMFTVAMILAVPCFINSIRAKIYELIFKGKDKKISTFNHVLVTFGVLAFCVLISISITNISIIMVVFVVIVSMGSIYLKIDALL